MLSRLSIRERDMVSIAAVIVILFIVIRFIFFPALDRRRALANQLHSKKNTLQEMSELALRYQSIKSSLTAEKALAMKRDKSFTLFSFIDKLAQESNVKENVSYMKPATRKSDNGDLLVSSVKIKLDGIVMRQAVNFIYKIEASDKLVYIPSLSISKTGEEQKLSAIIETETIMPSEISNSK
ncbi:MAG: type II secretion system protein M [Desulfamplus sp.]|nr:type II secretion system protein M [Desulfamplus sp.]